MKERSFKQQVKKAKETIIDNDKEWYDNFVKENFPKKESVKEKKRNNSPWLVVCAALAVIAAMISVCIVFRDNSNDTMYYHENERSEESSITELNSSAQEIAFNISNIYGVVIERIYDLNSDDTLYFNVMLSNKDTTYETINICVYTNQNYTNRKSVSTESSTEDLDKYTVSYVRNTVGDEPPYTVKYTATIEYKDIELYFEYSQLSEDVQGDFFEFVQNFFLPIDG